MRPSTSSETTPLVAPNYVFESNITRKYKKKLRHLQCAICVGLIALLTIALMVTVSFDLSQDLNTDVTTEPPAAPLNLSSINPELIPMLQLKWPLEGKSKPSWVGDPPTTESLNTAVKYGKAALARRKEVEYKRTPLALNTPAIRAQRASATAPAVKSMADAAYAAEEATRSLANGTDSSTREGGVGVGPPINGSFFEPPYCRVDNPKCTNIKYRSIDGTCNNLEQPLKFGVASTPFRRVLPADYSDGISSPRIGTNGSALPSARDVSVTVHRASYAHDSIFTVMLAVWGQFLDHDITATALSKGENNSALSCCDSTLLPHPECFTVPLDIEDPFYQDFSLTCMEFVRSAPAPSCNYGPRDQLNQATAFIDGSVVYGYRDELAHKLRTGTDGLLRMLKIGKRELLPQSTDPNDGCNSVAMMARGRYCFESGDDRSNENLHLTTMHLIWARQHNRLAGILKKLNPTWDDETLYQEARKIVGAQMQHITYSEFLPNILGSDLMWALNLTTIRGEYFDGYDPKVDPSIANHFAAAAFRFAHTLLPGLIHKVDADKMAMSYVRLHDILFNPYDLYGPEGPKFAVQSALDTKIHSADPHVTSELSNHLFEGASDNSSTITKKGPCGLDLVSLNIQRGRDHGLPSYPAWRELCGFERPKNFSDLVNVFDDLSYSRIVQIYRDVEDIDLYTGGLAEEPHGRLLGPTLTCLVADQFFRLKVGDRFWYETSDELVKFAPEQLEEIRKTTLAGVICANELLIDEIQPLVMMEVSEVNPLIDCMELPQPHFKAWKQNAR